MPPSSTSDRSSPHILFINRVYPPADGATGALLAELAAALVQRGWRVTVLTGPVEGAPPRERTASGVRVVRVRSLGFTRASTGRRALAYLSLYPALLARALRLAPAADVIVTKTDPPMLLTLGLVLKRLTRARLVHWAQDLYPEVAEELGVIRRGGALAGGLRALSTAALKSHDHVVAVGRCMRERVTARGCAAGRVSVIPNWPVNTVSPVAHEANPFRTKHDLEGRFVVMYSGNMGLAHPFETVLDAAERLAEHPDVVFLFVGAGPRKAWVREEAARRALPNVRFLPFQPKATLDQSLSAADVHLVTMQRALRGLVVPSKVYGVLAAGRPCLFLGPERSEAARRLREHRCGTVLPDPTAAELADSILRWRADADERAAAGARGHAFVQDADTRAFSAFDAVLRRVAGLSPVDSPHAAKAVSPTA